MKRVLTDPLRRERPRMAQTRQGPSGTKLRIAQDAWPELLGSNLDQAHELTELLGDHHDLAVLGGGTFASRPGRSDHGAFETAYRKAPG